MTESESFAPSYKKHAIPVVRTSDRLSITLQAALLAEVASGSLESRGKVAKEIGDAVLRNAAKVLQDLRVETLNSHPLKYPEAEVFVNVDGAGFALDLTDLPTLIAEEARKSIDAVPYGQDHVVIPEAKPMDWEKP